MRASLVALTFIEEVENIELSYNDFSDINDIIANHLPEQLNVNTADGHLNIAAQWTLSSGTLDPAQEEEVTLVFSGDINYVPDGYHRLDLAPIEVEVIISADNWLKTPSGPFSIQSNYPDKIKYTLIEGKDEFGNDAYIITFDVHKDYRMNLYYYYSYNRGDLNQIIIESYPNHVIYRDPNGVYLVAVLSKLDRPDPNTLYSGGNGSPDNPFIITNVDELQNMKYYIDGKTHFSIANDIVVPEDYEFTSLASQNHYVPFSGVIEGNNNKIINLNYTTPMVVDIPDAGIIDRIPTSIFHINNGIIQNLEFKNIDFRKHENSMKLFSDAILLDYNYGTLSNIVINGYKEGLGSALFCIIMALLKILMSI